MDINNLFSVKGKVAVVTGGSRGIGEMITAGFLANGVKVYISARKAPALIEKAEDLSKKYDMECIPIPCDLSTKDGIDDFVSQISSKENGIDFLINNAGAAWGETFENFSEGGWDKVMDLNVKSLFFLTQAMKSLLVSNASLEDPSRVINIGSIDGLNVPALPTFSYSASKAAVHHLTRAAWGETFENFSEGGWDKVMDLNVKSLFFLTQSMKSLLVSNASLEDPSRVINIGSIDGLNVPALPTFSYSASKAAVHHLTRVMAAQLVSENILVNAIAPGPYPSNMLGAAVNHDYSEIEKRNPRKRVGTPEDIAGLAIFLCSRAGSYTVGETITSDGGIVKTASHNLS